MSLSYCHHRLQFYFHQYQYKIHMALAHDSFGEIMFQEKLVNFIIIEI